MHVRVELRYAAPVPAVAAMLADVGYTRARVEASGAGVLQADVSGTAAGAVTVTTRRSTPSDQIPAQARAFVGSTLEVRQVEAWEAPTADDGARRGTVVVEIPGAPVRLTGTVTLKPDGPDASVLTYDGELKAGVPLFAAAIEQAAAGAVRSALQAEQDAGARWLAAR
ncbi:DUF2505 domain-containing protein [Cellulomonas aerilata]|uniref:DUF2505 domain-containing protein n=1 Tax=Cellulomonas aerilata TaxID=515326 RepID=A0A512DH85_9CELL|nr:DUF2505 domain-containing protein [Cellulomonas aerilata]GEO35825.1 hypothetical protein CAE01nite_35500 [Cellulomonas aerilata]